MATPPTTTGVLIDLASDLVRFIDRKHADGVLDLALYRAMAPNVRAIARLSCRVDAERRAATGLLACGRVPRDVAATLLDTAGDDDWRPAA